MGANPEGVLGLVIGQGLTLGAIGLALGLAVTMVSSRLLQGFLFGVSRTDALTLATVAGVVLAVTALASLVPAWRAAQVDPLRALAG